MCDGSRLIWLRVRLGWLSWTDFLEEFEEEDRSIVGEAEDT